MAGVRKVSRLIERFRRSQRHRLAAVTLEGYCYRASRLADALKLVWVGEIDESAMERYVERRRAAGGVLNRTVNLEIDALRRMTAWAAGRRPPLIRRDPLSGWRRLPERPTGRRRVLSRAEARRLCEHARHGRYAGGCPYGLLWLTSLLLGLRPPSELARLEWSDVDWREEQVYVRPGKTVRGRVVPLPIELHAALLARYLERGRPDGCVFGLQQLSSPSRAMRSRFRRCCSAVGIESARLYTLRHTYATWAAKAGVPPTALQRWLGHASLHTTLRYYVQVMEDWERSSAGRLDGML